MEDFSWNIHHGMGKIQKNSKVLSLIMGRVVWKGINLKIYNYLFTGATSFSIRVDFKFFNSAIQLLDDFGMIV